MSLASEHGFTDILQFLLDRGIPVDVINEDGETALIDAARAEQLM